MHQSRAQLEQDQTPNLDGFSDEVTAFANCLMEELDDIWPQWRKITPLVSLKYLHRARVKWLLKRLKQVTWRNNKGEPEPRLDWNVHVVPVRGDRNDCIAHPTYPHQTDRVDFWIPPKLEGSEVPAKGPSASVLAFDLGMSLERVERLLPSCPKGRDPAEWLADVKQRTGGGR